jgi:hypothetical protein
MKKIILIVLISHIALSGCHRTVPCSNQYITPVFVGFKISDLDTLVIREYKKDDNFIDLLDTALIATDNTVLSSGTSNDTTIVLLNQISGQEKYIFPDHDWQIYIPATNMIVSMSNFVSPQTDRKCVLGGDLCPGCLNPINSFLQNGQPVIPLYSDKKYHSGYLTYIHR